jgi:transmembrane sensor
MAFNAERILFLLKVHTDRKATPEEERELMDWLAEYEDDGSFQAHIQQLLESYPAEKSVGGVDWEKVYSIILERRDAADALLAEALARVSNPCPEQAPAGAGFQPVPPTHRVHFLKTSWFRYAAAVILVIGGASIWLAHQINNLATTNGNKHLQTDITPGGNKAVLTLANGQQIILDNAQNGSIAQQGSTRIIKLTSGQLAYSSSLQKGQGGFSGKDLNRQILYNTISTPQGGQYQIVLPDGSKVWLNAASSIKFPAMFTGTERNVELSGEAYMEIAKNLKQPFVVKASNTEIRVLGTSFNINAYGDEEAIKTTLIEGRVKVLKGSKGAVLKPGQQAVVVSSDQQDINVQSANIEQTLAWKNGLFNFNNLSLQQILRQLSRWYNIEIVYQQQIPSKSFSGEIQRDLNLSEVLEVLKDAGVHFTLEGRKLIVLP